jgi:hypothetical protein
VLGVLVSGAAGGSPWLWIVIPAAGVGMYLFDRGRARRTGRPMSRGVGFGAQPWYWQAIAFGVIGGITLYQAASSYDHWWWLLSAAAWSGFAWALVTRKPQ